MANSVTHASLPYPVKGARYTVAIPFLDADGDPTDPTTPDTEFSLDGAAFADCAEEITTITGSNGSGYITLTGAETNGSLVLLAAKVASGPKATLATLYPRVLPVIFSGTASAGAAGSITMATDIPAVADLLIGAIVKTTGGTGGGGTGGANNQARIITDFTTGRVATVTPNWETAPDATTTYEVLLTEGAALRYADVLLWKTKATATVHTEGYPVVTIKNGTGVGEIATLTGAVTTVTNVTNTVLAQVNSVDNSAITAAAFDLGAITASAIAANAIGASELGADAVAEIADAVWDELRSGHVTAGTFGQGVATVQGNVVGTVEGSVAGSVGSVSGNIGGSVVGNVQGSVLGDVNGNVNGTVVTVGLNAIQVGSFVANSVTASALATDAVTEIVNAAWANSSRTLTAAGLDAITATAPAGVATTFPQMVVQLWRRLFKKSTLTATQLKTYADDGTTVVTTQAVSDDATTQTQGAAT